MPYSNPENVAALVKGIESGAYKTSADVDLFDRSGIEPTILSTFDFSTPAPNRILVCLGGGQCSGKTVFKHFITQNVPGAGAYIYISSDVFKKYIPEFQALKSLRVEDCANYGIDAKELKWLQDAAYPFCEKEIKALILKIIDQAQKTGCGIMMDAQMYDSDFYKGIVANCKQQGYETLLIHPHIDIDTYFGRVQRRAERTGRRVLHPEFLTRHKQFAENWDGYLDVFDAAIMIDNNHSIDKGHTPQIVSLAVHGKNIVYDEETYAKAHDKIHLNIRAKNPEEAYQDADLNQNPTSARPYEVAGRFADERIGRNVSNILSQFCPGSFRHAH